MRAAALALVISACGQPPPFDIDSNPIAVDLSAGPLTIDVDVPGLGRRRAVLDTASPLTILDADAEVARRVVTLNLKNGAATRARFTLVPAILAPVGNVGDGTPIDVGAIVGGDVLSGLAVRLDPNAATAVLFPSIAGSQEAHEEACDAVFPVTPGGGGQFDIAGEQVLFKATRMAVPACVGAGSTIGDGPAGVDSLLLIATGVGPTVLARSAYRRLTGASDADIDALPTTTLYLGDVPGVTVPRGTLPDLHLVARDADDRGPCLELYLSRLLSQIGSCPQSVMDRFDLSCVCAGDNATCSAGAAAEIRRPVDVLIIDDTHPLLQAIRNELRPAFAEIDGLLGMGTLGSFLVDLDYPGSRVIFRCATGMCRHRPHIAGDSRDRARELSSFGCFPP